MYPEDGSIIRADSKKHQLNSSGQSQVSGRGGGAYVPPLAFSIKVCIKLSGKHFFLKYEKSETGKTDREIVFRRELDFRNYEFSGFRTISHSKQFRTHCSIFIYVLTPKAWASGRRHEQEHVNYRELRCFQNARAEPKFANPLFVFRIQYKNT